MSIFTKLFKRELKLFFSNSVAIFIFFAAPIGYALMIGSAYMQGKLTELEVLVVDSDDTPLSNRIIDALDDNQYLEVAEIQYLEAGAEDKVIDNDYVAVIYIPENFEGKIFQKRIAEINVELNGSNMVSANYASSGIQKVLGTMNAGIEIESMKKQGTPEAIAKDHFQPFKVTVNRFYNPANNYLHFIWPGIMGTVMQQVILIVMALSFAMEFENNTFRTLVKLSDSPVFLIFIKSIPITVLTFLMWGLVYYGFYPLFKVPLPADMLGNWTLIFFFTLANVFLGILVSIAFPSQLKATEILMAISLPSFILSGFTWPLEGMPGWLVSYVSDIIPLTHFLKAYRKLELMGASLGDVSGELWILIFMTAVLYLLSHFVLKYRIHKYNG
ncbi:ABC transporter permease [Gracilimonas mengyeensis]|uniref:ABC-2 type transport system permease protein n=1 Tax=Gracilimonas mengyeensis TaxID=1302730 RepID=A0A521FFD3_9BACT|nr:ABC transporter permease [Gracilimonas mengyeensis]SMO94694.1 ABC-2 type transport system permease protein [Gracilimonas mengyeensis]